MNGPSVTERNLLALSVNHPKLGGELGRIAPSTGVRFLTSRRGAAVPVCRGPKGPVQLHSSVDPLREGKRLLDSYRQAGYLVFLGLGGGYQIIPFLDVSRIARIVIVEKDPAFVRAVLEHIDLRPLLLDPRVRLLVGLAPQALQRFLLSDYLPAIYGDLKTVPLRPSVEAASEYYESATRTVREVIGLVADDYTVQAQFGKKWYVNTLANLPAVERSTATVRPARRALVTGAGPSLEGQIEQLSRLRAGALLIASDTSLPALLSHGLEPDLVISIDCQLVSYHHFLQGLPDDVPLVLDLASPPVLTRMTSRTLFFSSFHPLARHISSRWRPLPFIDTSGGNVSHAAVSLAQYLGAAEIHLFGVDFSYPEGKAYCRGTYLYPLFRSKETRLQPLEGLFAEFIFKNRNIITERVGGALRYTTKPLIGYKERLERYLRDHPSRIIPASGQGVPLNLPATQGRPPVAQGGILAGGAPKMSWKAFLAAYLQALQKLPRPTSPVSRYLHGLNEQQRSLWLTLFPAAAAFREHDQSRANREHRLLAAVLDWSVALARRVLDR